MKKKSCLDTHALIFSVCFRNSFVTSIILTGMYVIRTLQIRIQNVELRFYSVVTCLTLPILHNVFKSSVHAMTIRYRNHLNLGVLFHYCTYFAFLCVVKNEQETDSLGLSRQNKDDKLHR